MRRLVVNADDFGFTRDVNDGIIEAHRNGILNATTLMANGPAFDHAVRMAHESPGLDVGCHLVLVGGRSVLEPDLPLPASVIELVLAASRRRVRIYEELRAQIVRIRDAGLAPTHLDTHKHTHLLPPVLDAVARLSREFAIRWVRRPFDFPLNSAPGDVPLAKRMVSRGLGFLRARFHRTLYRYGCRTTDYFAGFQLTGRFRARELAHLVANLPDGFTEFMCHPGYCREELRSSGTRLKDSREDELRALTSPEVRRALDDAGVRLVSFRDSA